MAIIIDGKKLAKEILDEARREISSGKKLRLASILVGTDPASTSFLKEKERAAKEAGIDFRLYRFPPDITNAALRKRIAEIVHLTQNNGVILQLPLPEHLSTQYLLNAITPQKDVDCLSERSLGALVAGRPKILPPPVAVLQFLFARHGIESRGKLAVVVGTGRLIGKPVTIWLMQQEANVIALNEHTPELGKFTRQADIVISGVGKPRLISGDIIKEDAQVFDFGFSQDEGRMSGDVTFDEVKEKARLLTPVPGGMGPLTVAFLVKNLLTLSQNRK